MRSMTLNTFIFIIVLEMYPYSFVLFLLKSYLYDIYFLHPRQSLCPFFPFVFFTKFYSKFVQQKNAQNQQFIANFRPFSFLYIVTLFILLSSFPLLVPESFFP